MRTKSERYIDALAQLPQFYAALQDSHTENRVICALTGVMVQAVPDPDEEDHEWLEVTFPGGQPFQVIAPIYLGLQVGEAARHESLSAEDGAGPVGKRSAELLEHLRRKHTL